MPDKRLRFDVVHDQHGCHIDHHFCRQWDGDVGCYGTNPEHGMSFEQARDHVREWHRQQAEIWSKLTLKEWEDGHAR